MTVIDGQPDLGQRRHVLGADDAMVRRYGDAVWLIRDGRRSLINQGARAVLLALGLGEDAVSGSRPMSRALFDAIPVGPELSVPVIPGGRVHRRGLPGAPGPVGTVVSTPQVGGQTAYSVVLSDGMQPVSPVVAQVLQNAGPVGGGDAGGGRAGVGQAAGGADAGLVGVPAGPAAMWWTASSIRRRAGNGRR